MMWKRKALRGVSLALGILTVAWLTFPIVIVAQEVPECTIWVQPGESIQKAIDQAPEGAVICLSPGTYEENLVIEKSLTLRGEGENPDEVRITGAMEDHPVIQIESEREIEVEIENLAISDAKGRSADGIKVAGKVRVLIKNVYISDNWWYGLSVGGEARLTLIDSSVSQNHISGLLVDGTGQVEVRDSRFADNKAFGVIVMSGDAQIKGTNNAFHGNGADLGGFASASLRAPLALQTDRDQLSVPEDVASLQEAIDAIAPGGTITISAGTFTEGVTIWKPVMIQGAGPKETVLTALPERHVVISILAEAEQVTLTGLTVAESDGQGLAIYGQDVALRNVRVIDNDRWGLWAGGTATVSLQGSTVSSNWVGVLIESSARVDMTGCTVDGNRTGLAAGGSALVVLQDSTISANEDGLWVGSSAQLSLQNCTVSGNGGDGLTVAGSAQVTLTGSTVSHNWSDGLEVSGSAQVTIIDSVISSNWWNGLDVCGSPNVTLTECAISDNGYSGLAVRESAEMTVGNSTISGNEYGFEIDDSAVVTIVDSTICDSLYDGIIVNRAAELSLVGSTISNNEYEGLEVWGTATVTVQDCHFLNNEGFGIVVRSGAVQISGTNNVFRGNGADLGGFAPASLRAPVVPQSDRDQLAVPEDYPRLQEAIDAIVPGGTITVSAGTFVEGVTIWKSVMIKGAGPDKTILKGLPDGKVIVLVLAEVERVHLQDLKIAGSERDGLVVYGSDVTLQNVKVCDNRWDGLEVWGGAEVTVRDCTMSGNADGIDVRNSATLILENCTITDNRNNGLFVFDSAVVALANATISGSAYGLAVGGSAQVVAQSMTISDSGFDGVRADDSAQLSLINCTISNNGSEGVDVSDEARVTVKECSVFDNGSDGLGVSGSSQVNVKSSLISDNAGNGINCKEEAVVHIQDSHILRNAGYGVSAHLPDCVEDYYSSSLKFAGEVSGSGNTIPGPDEPDGNQKSAVCPDSLSFLQEGAARSEGDQVTTSQAAEANLADLVTGNTAFAFNLYQNLSQEGGNLFFSPYSISLALAMTYAGARSTTEEQMAETLHFTKLGQDRLHPAFNALALELASRGGVPSLAKETEKGKRFQLNIANALWGQDGYGFLPDFTALLETRYSAGLRLADFISAPEDARRDINDWVYRKTSEKIDNLLPTGSITPLTRLVLANAIYFNASWLSPFEKEATQSGSFHLLNGDQVTVPMMKQEHGFRYAKGDDYQAIELPYFGEQVSMLILLPAASSFEKFDRSLDAKELALIIEGLKFETVDLTMPKFRLTSEFSLADTLAQLGMPDAFTGAADFSGMDGTRDLFIGHVAHKAFVSIDEAGTEATAATAVVVDWRGVSPSPIPVIIDRPFIFLIRDIETGTILFIGRVMDPS